MIRPILLATALVSCVPSDELELGSIDQAGKCPVGGCGNNSPLLGPFKADELHERGLANNAGLILRGFVGRPGASPCTPTSPCSVDVQVDDLIVYVPNPTSPTGYDARTGSALTGGYLLVWQPGDASAVPPIPAGDAKINIDTWSKAAIFWQGPNGPVIDTYGLSYEIPGYSRGPVCGNPPLASDGEGNQWVRRFEAIFFTGDRYDHDTMTVTASNYTEAGDWFNIACAGSATMKLHLHRHTTAGATPSIPTNRAQRQTMLKMYSGDFCGTGVTYTVHGTKIAWSSNTGLTGGATTGINSFESIWNENGAVCLDHHRLASSQNNDEAGMEKMIKEGALNVPPTCRRMPSCRTVLVSKQHYLQTSSAALP